MATPIRMKDKQVTRMSLNESNSMLLTSNKVASDSANKGAMAQGSASEMSTEKTLNAEEVMLLQVVAELTPSEESLPATDLPATTPPALGDPTPASLPLNKEVQAPNESVSASVDLSPNLGEGKIVAETESK